MYKKKHACGARGITNFTNPMVMKLTKRTHTHPLEERDFKIIPINVLFADK